MHRMYFSASLNKGRKSACSFVTSLMTGYKDKKYSLIRQDSKGEFGTKMFLKMERNPWLAFFRERNVVRLWAAVSLGERLQSFLWENDCKRDYCGGREEQNSMMVIFVCSVFKVAPYSFWTVRELISKISRWRELSISTLKSRAESRSKMPTNMASKFLKFVYR